MRDELTARWLRLKPVVRGLILMLILVLLLAAGWWGRYHGIWLQLQQREQSLLIQQQTIQSRRLALAKLPAPEALQAQRQTLQALPGIDGHGPPLPALIAGQEAQVQAWQPDSQPPLLVLELGWQPFQRWFSQLAALTPPPESLRLRLERHQQRLQVQLWLESGNAL